MPHARHRTIRRGGKVYQYDIDPPVRYYRCYGISKGIRDCREHPFIRADRLEHLIWDEVERVIQQPEVIMSGIESLRTMDEGQLQRQMAQVERELRGRDGGRGAIAQVVHYGQDQ